MIKSRKNEIKPEAKDSYYRSQIMLDDISYGNKMDWTLSEEKDSVFMKKLSELGIDEDMINGLLEIIHKFNPKSSVAEDAIISQICSRIYHEITTNSGCISSNNTLRIKKFYDWQVRLFKQKYKDTELYKAIMQVSESMGIKIGFSYRKF